MTIFEQVLQDPDLSMAIISHLLHERGRLNPRTIKRHLHLARWLCAAWKDEMLWRELCRQHWPLAAQLQGIPSYRGLYLSMLTSDCRARESAYSTSRLLPQKARPEQFQFILEVDIMKNGRNARPLIRAVLQGTDASDDKQTNPFHSYWHPGNHDDVVGRDPHNVHWQVLPDVDLLRQCGLEDTVGSVKAWEEKVGDGKELIDLLEAKAVELCLTMKVYMHSRNKTCVLAYGESRQEDTDFTGCLEYSDYMNDLLPLGVDASDDESDLGALLDEHDNDTFKTVIFLGPAPDGEGNSMVWKLDLNMWCANEHRGRGGVFCMLDKLDERMWR